MSHDPITIMELIGTVAGTAGGGGLVALGGAWWFKRWANGIDKTLKALTEKVTDLRISSAVTDERRAQINGQMENLRHCVESNTKNVGLLHASVDKLWAVLTANKDIIVPERISDNSGG